MREGRIVGKGDILIRTLFNVNVYSSTMHELL
jgi:hypothetical protein